MEGAGASASASASEPSSAEVDEGADIIDVMNDSVAKLETAGDGSEAASAQYARLVAVARRCRADGRWSGVESIEELDPADIRLAQCDFYAALAAGKAAAASPEERAAGPSDAVARRARAATLSSGHLVDFLRLSSRLGALHPPEIAKLCATAEAAAEGDRAEAAAISRVGRATAAALDAAAAAAAECRPVALRLAARLEEADADSASGSLEADIMEMDAAARAEAVRALRSSPEARRAATIARFRRDRALERQLAALRVTEMRAAALARLEEDGVAGRGSEAVAGEAVVGEAARRDRATLELLLLTRKAVDDVISLAEEGATLGRLLAARDAAGGAAADSRVPGAAAEGRAATSPGLTVVHMAADMTTTRETIAAKVFGDPRGRRTLPLSVLAEAERAEAVERSQRQAEGESARVMRAAQLEEAGLEDDAEKVEAAAAADRAWDEWKDAHPRGMGVTKRV